MEKQISSISSFKRFLTRFLLPAIVIVGIIAVCIDHFFYKQIILKTEPTGGAYKIYRSMTLTSDAEIPIFGSSRASGSYIPDLLNENCFNYGIEKTQFNLLAVLLKNELQKNKHTPIIINFDYEIWANWVSDPANYIPNLNYPDIATYFQKEDKWNYHIPGIRFYGFYQHYVKSYFGNRSQKNYINKGGFFLLEKTPAEELAAEAALRKSTPFKYVSDPVKEAHFIQLASGNKDRKIFIVVAPYHNSYMQTLKGKESATVFFDKITRLKNVYVLDYGNADYADSLFKNTTHLNYMGAKNFSMQLKEKLHTLAPEYF